MAKKVERDRIDKFFEDRDVLEHYNDVVIAQKMGLTKSSYSSYVNGRYPITNNFLKKFYGAFEEELKENREKRNQTIGEENSVYKITESELKAMEGLIKRTKDLESRYEQMMEGYQLMSLRMHRLEQKMDKVLEDRLDNIEALLSQLVEAKKKSSK